MEITYAISYNNQGVKYKILEIIHAISYIYQGVRYETLEITYANKNGVLEEIYDNLHQQFTLSSLMRE